MSRRYWPFMAILSLGLLRCGDQETEPECVSYCEALNKCGFLPSALGSGSNRVENCEERCSNTLNGESESEDFAAARFCFGQAFPADDSEGAPENKIVVPTHPWCEVGDAEVNVCGEFQACLGTELGNSETIGQTRIGVSIRVVANADLPGAKVHDGIVSYDLTKDAEEALCSSNPELQALPPSAPASDACNRIASVLFMPVGGIAASAPIVCSEALNVVHTSDESTPAGVHEPRIKVLGQLNEGDMSGECRIISGGARAATAGDEGQLVVVVPVDPFTGTEHNTDPAQPRNECEGMDPETCNDGRDNDGDGYADAADVMCPDLPDETNVDETGTGATGTGGTDSMSTGGTAPTGGQGGSGN